MDATWPNLTAKAPRFADRLEAWVAAVLFGAFKVLLLDCASALGGALARRIRPFLGVSKHARRNLSRAFPELSETEIARVVASMWDNLGRVAAEYPHLKKIGVFEPGGRVETYRFEHVDRAVAAGRRDRGEFIPKGAVAARRAIAALQWQHVAVEAERQNGEGGGGHRGSAKERHRDAVIHLLVREQAQMRVAATASA